MNDAAEHRAFAQGVATALNWADHRCEGCGAGTWSPLTADWVQCQVCELAVSIAEIAAAQVEGRVRARLTAVKLPVMPPPLDEAARAETQRRYGA